MDWSSSKGPSWDWPELDQQHSFPSNSQHNNNDGSDVDLKLGNVTIASRAQLGNSSSVYNLPSKRARAAAAANSNSSTQAAAYYCLVDGCTSDLSNCRDYHRRHKVCEVHSKTPEVTILGRKQRFCQQCSRFHALDEFDEGKRSCRKRLDGHNRRRRKPQPETHLQQGTYLPNFPGAGMLSFSSSPSHTHTMASLISPNSWPRSVTSVYKLEIEDHYNKQPHLNLLEKQIPFTDYSLSRLREAKQLTFSQGVHQTIRHTPSQSLDHEVFYDGLANKQAPDSDCALSLLSWPLLPMHITPTETSFMNAIPMRRGEPSNHFNTQQPTAPCPDISVHNVFGIEPDVANEPQTLPFYWE